MTLLTTISNEAVNDNLQKRWTNAEIYTYIGAVLISVNPFKGQPAFLLEIELDLEPRGRSRAIGSTEHIDIVCSYTTASVFQTVSVCGVAHIRHRQLG